jgi:glycosyltransferase involved in cell wall biosynthesis
MKGDSKEKNIHIIAFSSFGNGISGGDRIWIEFATNWAQKNFVEVVTWTDGKAMYDRQNKPKAPHLNFNIQNSIFFSAKNFLLSYLLRIIGSIVWAMKFSDTSVVYSASEFLMDVFPAAILKLKNPSLLWIATWYQTAPSPFKGYNNNFSLNAFLYWFSQFITKFLITSLADKVLVNNELEKKQFDKLNKSGKVIVVLGAVDYPLIQKWQKKNKNFRKKYDAVFQGRFHPQKGVLELISIWEKVCKKKPDAKLVMIGDGPLYKKVQDLINEKKLMNNVILTGYLFDGDLKYDFFSKSKLVVHPALYDSGGMAAYEAMAFGLPVIGFDLLAYNSYYPKGMITVKIGNNKTFSEQILDLLKNPLKRLSIASEGLSFIASSATWKIRSEQILRQIYL